MSEEYNLDYYYKLVEEMNEELVDRRMKLDQRTKALEHLLARCKQTCWYQGISVAEVEAICNKGLEESG